MEDSNNTIEEKLKVVLDIKNKANEALLKGDMDESVTQYQNLLTLIEDFLAENKDVTKDNTVKMGELLNQKKLIMSNLALAYNKLKKYQESADLDQKVILMDPLFDKSYARIIMSFLAMGKKENALYYRNIMVNTFQQSVLDKHPEVLALSEAEQKKFDEVKHKT
jgi:two-component SAPR family response regulator